MAQIAGKAINRAESGMSRNVTQLTEIASRLAESDDLDSLTGIENRNRFHDHPERHCHVRAFYLSTRQASVGLHEQNQ
jgi:PleD family two-component response regulator